MDKLTEEHKENISKGLKERWTRKRLHEQLKDEVIREARLLAYGDSHSSMESLRRSIQELDSAMSGS